MALKRLQRHGVIGPPKLSDEELIKRAELRKANPIRRITAEQRMALELVVAGKSIEEAAEASGVDDLGVRIYRPDMVRAAEAIRMLMVQRLRDAALYQLACIGGAIEGRTPASPDEKVRAGALKTLVSSCRVPSYSADTLQPYGQGEDSDNTPTFDLPNMPPQLVITLGGEADDDDAQ